MKIILSAFLLLACLRAEEGGDRVAISRTISELNQAPLPIEVLADGADISLLDELGKGKVRRVRVAATPGAPDATTVVISHEPWGEARIGPGPVEVEVLNPRVVAGPVRFVTPEVAVVDATFVYKQIDGATERTPLLLVMRKEGEPWKVAVLRGAGAPSTR